MSETATEGSDTVGTLSYAWEGALRGATAWTIYAVVDYGVWMVAPLLLVHQYAVTGWHFLWSGVYLAAAAAAGAILGAAAGMTVILAVRNSTDEPGRWRQQVDLTATLTLLAPFLFSFAYPISTGSLARWFLLLCPALALALVSSLSSRNAANRLRPVTNPWVVSALLNGSFMISTYTPSGISLFANLAIPAGFAILVVAGSFLLYQLTLLRRSRSVVPGIGPRAAAAVGLGALCLGSSLMLRAGPSSLPPAASTHAAAASGPSVVLIILDSVRAGNLSLYGYGRDTAPFLRSLAREATLYENAYSTSDTSLGSHASIFTGMYPSWHGAHYAPPDHVNGRSLDPRIPTLASILSDRGYRTFCVAANNAYLSDDFGLTRGFGVRESRALLPMNWPEDFHRSFLRRLLMAFLDTSETDRLFRRAGELNDQIVKELDGHGRRAPFLLAVNYMDAHHPYLPPPPFDRMFPGKDSRFTYPAYQSAWLDINTLKRDLTEAERRHLISQYDGAIAYLDRQIGLLVRKLKEMGLYEDTMLLVTSDHGEAFGEKDLLEHGVAVCQNLVRVPLLVKYPGQRQGVVVREPVSGADLMPTVLARADIPIPSTVQGRDLLLGNGPGKLGFLLSESFPRSFGEGALPRFDRTERAVVSGGMKLIVSTSGKKELYDLGADPNEERNLYRADHPVARELEAKLSQVILTLPRRQPVPSRLDLERVRQLKSLGYIR